MVKIGKSRSYKELNKSVAHAIHHYDMISDGDRIAVGLSGGKDSMSLMRILHERLSRIPVKYALFPIYIDPGFEGGFGDELKQYCSDMGWHVRVEYTDYGIVAHSPQNRENPCFLCARLRRKRLFEIADEIGCAKLALGHNKDDIIETLFLNICYSGEISTMLPAQSMFDGRFKIIRPLAYSSEDTIRRFGKEQGFPEFINPCPTSRTSKRREIKLLIAELYRNNKKVRGNIFRALSHVKPEYLLKP